MALASCVSYQAQHYITWVIKHTYPVNVFHNGLWGSVCVLDLDILLCSALLGNIIYVTVVYCDKTRRHG